MDFGIILISKIFQYIIEKDDNSKNLMNFSIQTNNNLQNAVMYNERNKKVYITIPEHEENLIILPSKFSLNMEDPQEKFQNLDISPNPSKIL